ncbi:MAG TPA: class I SAM-dependent methyltransferase [Ktedonobacteraceae bacterium]|nr:class I SAM-dependent methyltransferase [Ktedonobacteraceae bacterium]
MPTPSRPHGEHPNTYFVEERFSKEEYNRLMIQEQMVTKGMGGVLPEQPDPTIFGSVLDIACGPGIWLISAAQTYPNLTELIGIDINARLLANARQHATEQGVAERVRFLNMDALGQLTFPDHHFDLVNQRSATSFLRTWDWPHLFSEMQRITRVGGIVRLTEPYVLPDSNSPAFNRSIDLLTEAFYQSGHLFSPTKNSVSDRLPDMMSRYGFLNVQTRDYTVEYRAGTPEGKLALENTRIGMRTSLPFIRKWTHLPNDYEELSQQALADMEQPGFVATWLIRTVWATVPISAPTFSQA